MTEVTLQINVKRMQSSTNGIETTGYQYWNKFRSAPHSSTKINPRLIKDLTMKEIILRLLER